MEKWICEKSKVCADINCDHKEKHDHNKYCECGCDFPKGIPEAKCIIVKPTGIELIAEERKRQIEKEGWDIKHDDTEHDNGGLALVGACYAIDVVKRIGKAYLVYPPLNNLVHNFSSNAWPWDLKWWKPTPDDPVRQLVKAGALIAAEIDRLQRQKAEK